MAVPVTKDKAGTIWVDDEGKRYVEVQRVEGLMGVEEVQLAPEATPTLRGWWNASEIVAKGLRALEVRR